jgi:uncharacterized protein DUF4383
MSSVSRLPRGRPGLARAHTAGQWFCLVVGVLLAVRGAQQFASGANFSTPGEGWRASQQLLTSLLLLVGQRTARGALVALIPFALYYAVLAVVGDINGHEAFGLFPVDTRDKFIHPLYAVLALVLLAAGWRRSRVGNRGS